MTTALRRLDPPDCSVLLDGAQVPARAGETVAALLLANGGWRPFHCGMGACFACTVTIDGHEGRACVERVRPGIEIVTAGDPEAMADAR